MLARKTIAYLAAAIVSAPLATTAFAAGQGLSDRIAHCEPASGAKARVGELTSELERSGQHAAALFGLHVARGRARSANCDFTGALTDFDRAIRIRPGSPSLGADFYIGRADAHLRLQEREPALADYDAALAQKLSVDDEAHVHEMRGFIHTDKGEEALAVADFSRLIKLKPDFADAYWLRAVSYENLNDYAHALADYDRLAKLRPDDWTGWSQICWGHAYLNRDLPEGLRACDIALRLKPDDPNTLDGRGFVNLRLGRFADAVADYDAALQREPRLPGSLYLRGVAKLRLGNSAGANLDFAAAEHLEPGIAGRFAGYGIVP
jgi:tetratricopeptide (TPR) repeat protein